MMAMSAAMSNWRGRYFWFVCFLSLQKATSLLMQTGCSLIADEIKDAACGCRNTLSGYSTASQSAFAGIYILGNHYVSVPYSACFIIIINIPFCHLSCLWCKVVESTSVFWKQRRRWKNPSSLSPDTADPACLLGLKCISYNRCYWAQSFHCICPTVFLWSPCKASRGIAALLELEY